MDATENIKKLFARQSLLDVAIQMEELLDSMNIYVYPNWANGILLEGPIVSRYWATMVLKYDFDEMPDPRGAMVLSKIGVKVKYEEDIEAVPVKVEDPSQYRPGTKKPKLEKKRIWLVTVMIPRRLIDEADIDDLDLIDDEADVDNAFDANHKGL